MKIISALGIAGLCVLLPASAYFFLQSQPGSLVPGSLVPGSLLSNDFQLPDRAGTIHRLSDLKGAPVVLHFWASWCPPCLGEISKWVELASSYHERPIHWVAISLDQNWADALRAWNPTGPGLEKVLSLLDTEGKVSDRFGTYQFPETYLLNSELKVVTKWVGPQDWGGDQIRAVLDQLVK